MQKITSVQSLLAASAAILCATALAQQPDPYGGLPGTSVPIASSQKTGGIPIGPLTAYPSLNLSIQHNDNLYSSATNKTSAVVTVLTPSIRFDSIRVGGNEYGLTLGLGLGNIADRSADNYTDVKLGAYANLDMSTRLRAALKADSTYGHDARGTTNDAAAATPNEYRQLYTGGIVSYGAPGAKGRLEFELGQTSRRYTNNRDSTQLNDNDRTDLGATFFWRVAPKTELLMQGKESRVNYSLAPGTATAITLAAPGGTPYVSANSKEDRVLVGVKWEATAKTTGIFKIGTLRKDFLDRSRQDTTSTNWDGTIRWSPLTYSVVDLSLSRNAMETSGNYGNYVLNNTSAAKWTHQWNSQVSTDVTTSYANDTYQGLVPSRKDNTLSMGATLNYKMRRWLTMGGGYTYTDRDSDQNLFDYKRNLFMLYATGTL